MFAKPTLVGSLALLLLSSAFCACDKREETGANPIALIEQAAPMLAPEKPKSPNQKLIDDLDAQLKRLAEAAQSMRNLRDKWRAEGNAIQNELRGEFNKLAVEEREALVAGLKSGETPSGRRVFVVKFRNGLKIERDVASASVKLEDVEVLIENSRMKRDQLERRVELEELTKSGKLDEIKDELQALTEEVERSANDAAKLSVEDVLNDDPERAKAEETRFLEDYLGKLIASSAPGAVESNAPNEVDSNAWDDANPGDRRTLRLGAVELPFRYCPKGNFIMGALGGILSGEADELYHRVKLTRDFWLLETETTQRMWEAVMGDNPSYFKGDDLPVEQVSWNDCRAFIVRLNELNIAPNGWTFRLPTEAEWEFACKTGVSTDPYYWGFKLNGDMANCDGTKPNRLAKPGKKLGKTAPVGSYPPNNWGLCDMSGNVWEWTDSTYEEYPETEVVDPNPQTGALRVNRGGSWLYGADCCRSANRNAYVPTNKSCALGFRFALVRK